MAGRPVPGHLHRDARGARAPQDGGLRARHARGDRRRFEGGFSFQTTGLPVNDNGPTHVDSFSHLDPDPSAAAIDQMPLELFCGDAICLDVSGCASRTDIEPEELDAALERSGVELGCGDVLLLYTATGAPGST